MKKIGFAAPALLMMMAAAFAADLPMKAALEPTPVYSWTGFYVGGNVGGAWSRNSGTITFLGPLSPLDPFTGNTGGSAAIGGFQEGINWQFARTWVVGIEGDWSWTNAGRGLSQALTFGGIPLNFPSNGSLGAKLDWLASARNRLGYLVTPNLMIYGTGGVAWGKIDYAANASLNDPVGFIYTSNAAFSHTEVGWVAGGGLEWMFADHWLLRGEYLYYRLDSPQSVSSTNPLTFNGLCLIGKCPPPLATVSYSWANMNVNVVRAALSYKF
jgi:outer membrane immunogenic protein